MQYPAVDIQSPFLSVLFLELVMFYCQIIELLVPLCLLLLVPKVATAGESVSMVYLLGSELGLLLRHGNPYYTLCPFAIAHSNLTIKHSALPSFCDLHLQVNDVILKLPYMDKFYRHS